MIRLALFLLFLLPISAQAQQYQDDMDNFNENLAAEIENNIADNTDIENNLETTENKADDEVIILDTEELPWIVMQEPPKSDDNKIRIKFEDGVYSISKEDKIAVDSMLKLMGDNEELSFKIKSYTSSEIDADKSISQSVIRLQKLMKYLSTKNISFEKTKLYTYSSDQNEYDINYIDIDKL